MPFVVIHTSEIFRWLKFILSQGISFCKWVTLNKCVVIICSAEIMFNSSSAVEMRQWCERVPVRVLAVANRAVNLDCSKLQETSLIHIES